MSAPNLPNFSEPHDCKARLTVSEAGQEGCDVR